MLLRFIEQIYPEDLDWQKLCQRLQSAVTLTTLILIAWQIGLYIARMLVEQQLSERAQQMTPLGRCPACQTRLVSKGWSKRRILTLVGWVRWKRRIGRCPHKCPGGQSIRFDDILGIQPYQQTSTELMRLGCLLAVFLPFDLASQLLLQLTGVAVSNDTVWNWVQGAGQRAMKNLQLQLQHLADGQSPEIESLDSTLEATPLIITADGVTVPFRPQPNSPKGKIVWQEVKIALLARLGKHQTKAGVTMTRLHQRRLVGLKQKLSPNIA